MDKELLNYIDEEKSISKYKITLLKKGPSKAYKDRLLSIESDFISYPFRDIAVDSPEALKDALGLFRADRSEFDKTYSPNLAQKTRAVTKGQVRTLWDKIAFYKKLYRTLVEQTAQEINIIQNEYIRGKVSKELRSEGVDSLLEAEGAALSKERARMQILIYALGRYVYHESKSVEESLGSEEDVSADTYDAARARLNSMLDDVKYNIFKYYNDGIIETPLITNGTLGHNNFIRSIHPLVNLIDESPAAYRVSRVLPMTKPFFRPSGRPARKRFVERGFSVVTPISRVGNESISLLHIDLWSDSGISLAPIMEKGFYNYRVGKEYYKAIATVPVWNMERCIDNPFLRREVLALLSLSKDPLMGPLDFSDKNLTDKINNISNGEITICSKFSKILVAATRSESEHIKQACSWIDLLIKQIKNDYKTLFSPTGPKGLCSAHRVARVTSFVE